MVPRVRKMSRNMYVAIIESLFRERKRVVEWSGRSGYVINFINIRIIIILILKLDISVS